MIEIRTETDSDRELIHEVTESAFKGKQYADGDEQDLIDTLRSMDALSLSLVALEDGKLVGQISFSPANISVGTSPWYALGPVSVLPGRQGFGIGSQLIEAGILEITNRGALGCILTGDPNYYFRFGFKLSPDHCPDTEPEEYFMLKLLNGKNPEGKFSFHEAFTSNA